MSYTMTNVNDVLIEDNKMLIETTFQKIASKYDLSPKIKEIDTDNRFIVMEKLDFNLIDYIKKNKGVISTNVQRRIIEIINTLDKIKVFHGDPNPLNFMFKKNKLYIIDFGFSKKIDITTKKEYDTLFVNKKFMILGLLIKLKEIYNVKFPEIKCELLKNTLSSEEKLIFNT